jgi:hypothetical protein
MRGTSLGLFVIAAAALLVAAGYGLWLKGDAPVPKPDGTDCTIARGHGVAAPAPEIVRETVVAAPATVARTSFPEEPRLAATDRDAAHPADWEIDFDEAFPWGVDGYYRSDLRENLIAGGERGSSPLRVRMATPDGADLVVEERTSAPNRPQSVRFTENHRSTVAVREGAVVRFAPGTDLGFGGSGAKNLMFLHRDRPWAATPPGAAPPDAAAPRTSVCRPVRARFRARIVDARGEAVADGAFVETRRVPDEHGVFVVPTGPGRFDVVASAVG